MVSLRFVLFYVVVVGGVACGASIASSSPKSGDAKVCAHLCEPICVSASSACFEDCVARCAENKRNATRTGLLSEWITFQGAIQHVGLTTSDLNKSVHFYTQVMGGVEVMYAGGDGWRGDDVYQLLMQAALLRGGLTSSWAANLSATGPDVLNARYVAFDNVVIELLDYRSEEAMLQRALRTHDRYSFPRERRPSDQIDEDSDAFPKRSPSNVAPSVVGNMHISFNVRPDKDLNEFVEQLESVSHANGYDDVYCNRIVPVEVGKDGRPNVTNVPLIDNSYEVTEGDFQGWSLSYCKGPDGEQLEFNKVEGNATRDFEQALRAYLEGKDNPIW